MYFAYIFLFAVGFALGAFSSYDIRKSREEDEEEELDD